MLHEHVTAYAGFSDRGIRFAIFSFFLLFFSFLLFLLLLLCSDVCLRLCVCSRSTDTGLLMDY